MSRQEGKDGRPMNSNKKRIECCLVRNLHMPLGSKQKCFKQAGLSQNDVNIVDFEGNP